MAINTKQIPTQQKGQKVKPQVIESLRDLTGGAVDSLVNDVVVETPKDLIRQFLGEALLPEKRVSGELVPGETLEITDALSGEAEKNKKLKAQLVQERRLRQEEQAISVKKQQELRIQISALSSEVAQLAKATQGLSQETKIAAMQAPIEPGVYHLVFFEKLIEFIRSFREKIEDASVWIAAYNTRARKRAHTFWSQVGISGAKRLLSAEDYLQRAAA